MLVNLMVPYGDKFAMHGLFFAGSTLSTDVTIVKIPG
jgi:hypothetical protein